MRAIDPANRTETIVRSGAAKESAAVSAGRGRRRAWVAALAIGVTCCAPRLAVAQGTASAATAQTAETAFAVSPYLNLQGNIFGNLPQYNLQVQPFINTQNSLSQSSQQIDSMQRGAQRTGGRNVAVRNNTFGTRNASALVTGHSTRFMQYSHYFPAGRR